MGYAKNFHSDLRCPECHLDLDRKDDGLVCANDHAHEIISEVPILLSGEEKSSLQIDVENSERMEREFTNPIKSKIIWLVKLIIGSSLAMPLPKTVKRLWENEDKEKCLDLGSGTDASSAGTVSLDIDLFSHVGVVGSALNIPFKDESFTRIKNIAVLEHLRDPHKAVDEMYRVLKPGGYVYAVTPFLLHFHAYPDDFERYTVEGLKKLFHEFEVVETGVRIGAGSTITTLVADWFELWTFTDNRAVNDIVRLIPLILLFPLKFFDYFLNKNPRAHEYAQALYIVCKKPSVG